MHDRDGKNVCGAMELNADITALKETAETVSSKLGVQV